MQFELTEEQTMLLDALVAITGEGAEPERCVDRYIADPALEEQLQDAGFFSLAQHGYSTLEAVLVAIGIGKLPVCVEAATSLLIGPLLPETVRRPIAIVRETSAGETSVAVSGRSGSRAARLATRPIRFLSGAHTLVILADDQVSLVELQPEDVRACTTHYAYPYGVLVPAALERAVVVDVPADELLRRYRLAIAAEITGAADAALQRTLRQVKEREQFGKPIGAFQAVQHRLAMAATSVEACRVLTLRAADGGDAADAAAAAGYAQEMARQLTFDLHQFSGAMGLTLEYPLHLWTYRIRALQAESGGSQEQFAASVDLAWPPSKSRGE
ncbi:acyl-CoA dehydrogenase family protein [Peristeroidobacter soli]|uniref:acyl-CoA dehydrogenase family protein n=1 Tax=Peristeroidobacter soli TaxID=2497877 RepID=UPI00101C75C9|nr:acyl-CoA dehydrogenase family protein [Peristeroidobacter soli]